jgi:GAF domain-containing protein
LTDTGIQSLADDELASLLRLLESEQARAHLLMNVVIPIGVALAYETEFDHLLERILIDAMNLCSADGGALYLRGDDDLLRPAILRIESLNLTCGGTSKTPLPAKIVPILNPKTDSDNQRSVAARAALLGLVVNLHDMSAMTGPDGIVAEAFQQQTGYHVCSVLALPLRASSTRIIGVVELVNACRPNGEISPFEPGMQQVVESLCLLASAALESYVRQQKLKDQVRDMRIQVDEAKKAKQVTAIVETEYFKALRDRARKLRTEKSTDDPPANSQGSENA